MQVEQSSGVSANTGSKTSGKTATPETILVAGASGITGSYISDALRERDGAKVIGLSRGGEHGLAADLTDAASLNAIAPQLGEVTQLVYAGFAGGGAGRDWGSLTKLNVGMFRNLIDAVEQATPRLKRVLLVQGQKYYGTHLGPFRTPAKETDPRHAGENFYFNQEDLLAERSARAAWDYVCLRPHIVCGFNEKAPQNPVSVVSRYAMTMKRAGQPLSFPGHPDAFGKLSQATEATLLGKAAQWALDEPSAGGEGFNVINGDYFRWEQLWPIIAEVFEMPVGEPNQQDLTQTMPAQMAKHLPGVDNPDWGFANYMWSCTWDVMACTLKARRHGFGAFTETEPMFRSLFTQARQRLEAS